eukprot:15479776-Alexandrium_andersonii.AAC.1
MASQDSDKGERPGFGAGVYVHNANNRHLAESYVRYVPLFRDGYLWTVKWELRVDRADRYIPTSTTNQWLQAERSVRLVALWIKPALAQDLIGCEANPYWEPLHEAHPMRTRLGTDLERERSYLLSLAARPGPAGPSRGTTAEGQPDSAAPAADPAGLAAAGGSTTAPPAPPPPGRERQDEDSEED